MKSPARGPQPEVGRLAFVALGSNLGDSASIVRAAMERLRELSDEPLLRSSLWRTEPIDCPPESPGFVNAIVGLRPRRDETPETLLARLLRLEREFGRRPQAVRNAPRCLDLDLLVFGAERRDGGDLTLPHPRAHLRHFVLAPWSEIAPALVIPGQTRSVTELLDALGENRSVQRM